MKSWLNKLKQMAERQPVDGPQMQQPSTDISRVTRFGMLSLLIGFGGFLAWAAWAPLDEGVPASGLVIVDSKRKAIQHLQGGIVEKILVRDGDLVKVHQPLIKLVKPSLAQSCLPCGTITGRARQSSIVCRQSNCAAAKSCFRPSF